MSEGSGETVDQDFPIVSVVFMSLYGIFFTSALISFMYGQYLHRL